MRILFTCGGTGGHINPAIAVAKLCLERERNCEVLFVGAEDGMENQLVPREGFRLETLKISNFQRKLTPAGIWHNMTTLVHMAGSLQKAKKGERPVRAARERRVLGMDQGIISGMVSQTRT